MPQNFLVLKCFRCNTFQVHVVKKAKKWDCKLCGERQSMIKHFGMGNSKDCRNHVQKLNMLKVTAAEEEEERTGFPIESQICEKQTDILLNENKSKKNKWLSFIEEDSQSDDVLTNSFSFNSSNKNTKNSEEDKGENLNPSSTRSLFNFNHENEDLDEIFDL